MSYQVWAVVGLLLAWLVRRSLRQPGQLPEGARRPMLAAAVAGAVGGAYLAELPADLYGWTWNAAGPAAGTPLFGRTVLGGLIGGWIAVEIAKLALGQRRVSTGDGFAAPLAAALMCGRLGCWSVGCCAGAVCPDGAWWSPWACPAADGVARFPAQFSEAVFHAVALIWLVAADRRGWQPGRRLAWYLGSYALVRFMLEFVRANPGLHFAGGLTWYQLLAGVLFIMAALTLVLRRTRPAPETLSAVLISAPATEQPR